MINNEREKSLWKLSRNPKKYLRSKKQIKAVHITLMVCAKTWMCVITFQNETGGNENSQVLGYSSLFLKFSLMVVSCLPNSKCFLGNRQRAFKDKLKEEKCPFYKWLNDYIVDEFTHPHLGFSPDDSLNKKQLPDKKGVYKGSLGWSSRFMFVMKSGLKKWIWFMKQMLGRKMYFPLPS